MEKCVKSINSFLVIDNTTLDMQFETILLVEIVIFVENHPSNKKPCYTEFYNYFLAYKCFPNLFKLC